MYTVRCLMTINGFEFDQMLQSVKCQLYFKIFIGFHWTMTDLLTRCQQQVPLKTRYHSWEDSSGFLQDHWFHFSCLDRKYNMYGTVLKPCLTKDCYLIQRNYHFEQNGGKCVFLFAGFTNEQNITFIKLGKQFDRKCWLLQVCWGL